MYVYVDESGDCGFKFAENSSTHFVVTALIIDDPVALRGLIDGFKAKYRISATRELKFRSISPEMRLEFLASICTTAFRAVSVVVDKTRLASHPDATSFYREHVTLVVVSAGDAIANARLVIDESVKDKRWKGKMKAHLRQEINRPRPGCLRDIRFADASGEPLLQAADMICGSIRIAIEGRDDRYLRVIEDRLIELVVLPAE